MRLVTCRIEDRTRAGRLEGGDVVLLDEPDVGALLARGSDWQESARSQDGSRVPLSEVHLAPVVVAPPAIVCVGQNYAAHLAETGADRPAYPTLFAKYSSALIGANDPLLLPRVSDQVDWEVELAFVIGGRGRYVDEAEAADLIAGYTVANDVSVRDWQGRTSQFLQGKTFGASTPVGPALVTPDELPEVGSLTLTCEVDGVTMQRGSAADLIFGPTALVSYLSSILALEPGMLVLTGTPSGIGAARQPPVFLRPGQEMRTRIEGIGELVNRCLADEDSPTDAQPVSSTGSTAASVKA